MSVGAFVTAALEKVGETAAAFKETSEQAASEIARKMAEVAKEGGVVNFAERRLPSSHDGFRIGEMPEANGEGREVLKQKEAEAADALHEKLGADVSGSGLEGEPGAKVEMEPEEVSKINEQSEKQEALRRKIKEETGWSDEIVNDIRNEGEYDVYKKANLKEGTVNGKHSLQQREIDPSFEDDFGRTNLERMKKGLAPYDAETGEKIVLHHMGQRADSPFAELRENTDHSDGNHHVLHDLKTESWRREPGREAEYAEQKTEYWKARAQQLEEQLAA